MLKQLGIDPKQAKALQGEVQKLMADPVKRKAMETLQQQMQGNLQKLQRDPELKAFFEDVRTNGMGAMRKYEKDEGIMQKLSEATVDMEQMATVMPGGIAGANPSSAPADATRSTVSSWQPGQVAIIQGLQARPELNGAMAMVVPPDAEEAQSIKGTGRLVVRLLESGEQFAVKADNLGREAAESLMAAPATASEAARLWGAGKLEALEGDPELRPILDDIRQNGMAALEKYWSNVELMAKMSRAMGLGSTAQTQSAT